MKAESRSAPLTTIIEMCLDLDRRAATIYERLSVLSTDRELRGFWAGMSGEERQHCRFWKSLLNMARRGELPQVFDRPEQVIAELHEVRESCREFEHRLQGDQVPRESFLLALRLETVMMHPAFETLFGCFQHVADVASPGDQYEEHLDRFVEMMHRSGSTTPELELVSATMKTLWDDNRRLVRQIMIDPLTGILNRRGFFDATRPVLHLAQRRGLRVGVMMADLDDFKRINDVHGHQAGDAVLREVAGALKRALRAADIIGRYGGEEFVVLLSSLEPGVACELGERVRREVSEAVGTAPGITISVGIGEGLVERDVEVSLEALIRRADACMYRAKRDGKNRVVCESPPD